MASPTDPVHPITEFTRNMVSPGMTIHELYTMHLLAAQVSSFGMHSITAADIDAAKLLASQALAHRTEAPAA